MGVMFDFYVKNCVFLLVLGSSAVCGRTVEELVSTNGLDPA